MQVIAPDETRNSPIQWHAVHKRGILNQYNINLTLLQQCHLLHSLFYPEGVLDVKTEV